MPTASLRCGTRSLRWSEPEASSAPCDRPPWVGTSDSWDTRSAGEPESPVRLGGNVAVELDEQLLEILACPCPEHGALRPGRGTDAQADYLTCSACGAAFPVRDCVPVL